MEPKLPTHLNTLRTVHVVAVWRFPVKSLGGELLTRAEVGPVGISGDRQWAIRDSATGKFLTARREPRLLFGSACVRPDGEVAVTLPDGHASLSDWLGYEVELVRAEPELRGTYENPLDFEHDADWIEWTGPAGVFHDSRRRQVTLVSTQTLGDWDLRRFRANVIVEGGGEDEFVGRVIRVGECALDVNNLVDRCVMTTRPQPGLDRDLDVLRTINRQRGGTLAIGCLVHTPGFIAIGDEVRVD